MLFFKEFKGREVKVFNLMARVWHRFDKNQMESNKNEF
jgi:hypothetical protein